MQSVTEQQVPALPEMPAPPTEPKKDPFRAVKWAAIGLGAVIVLGGTAGALVGQDQVAKPVADGPETVQDIYDGMEPGTSQPQEPVVEPAPEPEVSYRLTRDQVDLRLQKTHDECFDSAGGLMEFKVLASVDGIDSLPRDGEWDVTFKITGNEGGPYIDTFTMTGHRYEIAEPMISTPSCATRPEVSVVSVMRVGGGL